MTEPEFIDPHNIQPGPIRHASLPEERLGQIKEIHDVIAPFLNTTLEQFEINFMRDTEPEQEIALWTVITAAWVDYHDKFLNGEDQDVEHEKKLLATLLLISMGAEEVSQFEVPEEIGRRLQTCFGDLGKW